MYELNKFNASVTTAFAAGINHLPKIRSDIKSAFPNAIHDRQEACIYEVHMRAAATFSVTLNESTKMSAVLHDGGEYGIDFEGSISELIFDANATLTYLQVNWATQRKNHCDVTFTVPQGATLTLENAYGSTLTSSDTLKYELRGYTHYIYSLSCDGYVSKSKVPFFYDSDADGTVALTLVPEVHTATFALTPETAAVVVKTAGNVIVEPTSAGVYSLADSRAVGVYSYVVSADGYVSASGTIDAQSDITETVTLTPADYAIAFNVTPAPDTITVKDATGTAITPVDGVYTVQDYRVSGAFTYEIVKEGYTTVTGEILNTADGTITVEMVAA